MLGAPFRVEATPAIIIPVKIGVSWVSVLTRPDMVAPAADGLPLVEAHFHTVDPLGPVVLFMEATL